MCKKTVKLYYYYSIKLIYLKLIKIEIIYRGKYNQNML